MQASEARGREPVGRRARSHQSVPQRYQPPGQRRGLVRAALRGAAMTTWFALWLVAVAAAGTALVDVDVEVPGWVARAGAGGVTVLHTVALSRRAGSRTFAWGVLVTLLVAGGLAWAEPWALSAVAVLCAVASAVAAVLVTRPAATVVGVVVELMVTVGFAAAGGVAVAAVNAPLESQRFALPVIGLALVLAIVVVWQLGAGLHGLGRRGLGLIIGFAAAVTLLVVYTEALSRYGSATLLDPYEQAADWSRDRLGGVPRPVEALLGIPVLIWGVATRSQRRQGWWMCAFGVVGTGTIATTLAAPRVDPVYAATSLGYSVLIGLVLGLVVVQVDRALTRSRSGRRAARTGGEVTTRPEPARTHPLR